MGVHHRVQAVLRDLAHLGVGEEPAALLLGDALPHLAHHRLRVDAAVLDAEGQCASGMGAPEAVYTMSTMAAAHSAMVTSSGRSVLRMSVGEPPCSF